MSSVFKTANVSHVCQKTSLLHAAVHLVPPLYPRGAARSLSGKRSRVRVRAARQGTSSLWTGVFVRASHVVRPRNDGFRLRLSSRGKLPTPWRVELLRRRHGKERPGLVVLGVARSIVHSQLGRLRKSWLTLTERWVRRAARLSKREGRLTRQSTRATPANGGSRAAPH
jgi:hypothetical protein